MLHVEVLGAMRKAIFTWWIWNCSVKCGRYFPLILRSFCHGHLTDGRWWLRCLLTVYLYAVCRCTQTTIYLLTCCMLRQSAIWWCGCCGVAMWHFHCQVTQIWHSSKSFNRENYLWALFVYFLISLAVKFGIKVENCNFLAFCAVFWALGHFCTFRTSVFTFSHKIC